MSLGTLMALGRQGIQTGASHSTAMAGRIAADGTGDALASSLVGLKSGEIQVKASACVVRAGDRLLGTLIDLKA